MKKPSVLRRDPMLTPCITLLVILVTSASLSGCGGGGGGSSSSSSIAPTASSSAVSTTEDTPTSSTLTASDADGDPLTYMIASQGAVGIASITNPSTGAFIYTPNADENGTDNFTFKVSDGSSDSNIATVTITITAMGDTPVAQADSLTVDEDTSAGSTLHASDADGDPLTYSVVSQASRGTVNITDPATGAFTYTPDANENGTDVFTFNANDGSADSNIASVSININPVNDPPTATGSCGTTPQAQTLAGTLGATDPETPALLTYALNADGSGGTGPIFTAKGGTVTITDQTTGAFTYQPNTSAGDRRGLDTFDYQVSDPDGGAGSATETVIIDQKIMPLGDSITLGTINPTIPEDVKVGYRKPLYDTLIASGFTFDFVGSLNHGWAVLADSNHEGWGGWTASELAWGGGPGSDPNDTTDGIFGWLTSNPADVVLLHAGTNGLDPNGDIDVEAILDEIDRWESASGNPVTVILARIINQDPYNQDVTDFNINLEEMANNRINDDIIIVDQEFDAGLVYTIGVDMSDKLHPNDSGYAKMGNLWFNAALAGVIDKCP